MKYIRTLVCCLIGLSPTLQAQEEAYDCTAQSPYIVKILHSTGISGKSRLPPTALSEVININVNKINVLGLLEHVDSDLSENDWYNLNDGLMIFHYSLSYTFKVNSNYLDLVYFSTLRKLNHAFRNHPIKNKKNKIIKPPYTKELQNENIDDLVLMLPQASFTLINKNEDVSSFENNLNDENPIKLLKLVVESNENVQKAFSSKINPESMKIYTASHIQEVYEKNEIKGDLLFKGKQFIVTGKIASIDSAINNEPAVHFLTDSGNPFQAPSAIFKDYESKIEQIAELSKGEDIKLSCIGGGEVIGSPLFNNCEFIKSDTDLIVDYIVKEQGESDLKGGYQPLGYDNLFASIKALSLILPDSSACFNDKYEQCKQELIAIPNYKIRQASQQYHLTRDIMHAAFRKEMDSINQEQIKKYNNSKEINDIIEYKEKCYIPILTKLF